MSVRTTDTSSKGFGPRKVYRGRSLSFYNTQKTGGGTSLPRLLSIVFYGLVLNLDAGNTNSYPGSGTTWTDLSGNGNNGTLVNGVGYDGNEGGSLSFDGDDDYIDLGTQPIDSDLNMSSPSGGGLTVDWWGYYNGTGDSFQRIVDRSNASSSGNGWAIYTDSVGSSTDIRLTTNGESVIITSSQQMVANVWQHWCITWDQSSGNWVWYLNGQQTNNGNSTWNIPAVETGMRIGTWNHSTGREYNGKISNIKIYNRALTAAEVQQNYNVLVGRFSPYQFNFESFPNGSHEPVLTFVWSANGEPTHVNNHIYLTEITGTKSPGNVWYNTILSYNRDWELYVNFECSGGSGADGWCVQWHTSNNQLGDGGGDCGRINDGSNVPYVFSFETFGTDGIETYINSVSQGKTSVTDQQFRQNLHYWLVYNHAASTVDIFYSTTNTKPGTSQHTYTSRSFSSTEYYIGIGAAYGGANDNHILKAMSLEFT